jgi:hypothetical protein
MCALFSTTHQGYALEDVPRYLQRTFSLAQASIKWLPGFDVRCLPQGLPHANSLKKVGKGWIF